MEVFNTNNCSCPEVVAAITAALSAHFGATEECDCCCCCTCTPECSPAPRLNPWSLKTRTLRNPSENRNPWIFKTLFKNNALTPGR